MMDIEKVLAMNPNLTDSVFVDNGTTVSPVPKEPQEKVIVPVLFFLLAAVGVGINSVALTSICRKRKQSSVTDIYLASHCFANLIYLGVFVPFIAVSYGITDWIFGKFACHSLNYGMTVCLAASMLSVTSACLHNAFAANKRPSCKTLNRSRKVAFAISSAIWSISAVAMIPRVFLYQILEFMHLVDQRRFCVRNAGLLIFRQLDTFILFLAVYLVPVVVQAGCHFHTFKELAKLRQGGHEISKRLKLAHVLCGISVGLALGWLPTHVIKISEEFLDGGMRILFQHREVLMYSTSYACLSVPGLILLCCYRRQEADDIVTCRDNHLLEDEKSENALEYTDHTDEQLFYSTKMLDSQL